MDQIEIKRTLINLCEAKIKEEILVLKKAMDEAQADAKSHKGAMESRYDTFKEEAQALRDGYARQLQQAHETLEIIQQIPLRLMDIVQLGAIIATDEMTYFVSANVFNSPVEIDGDSYLPISFASPICQTLRSVLVGDIVNFRGREIAVMDIW